MLAARRWRQTVAELEIGTPRMLHYEPIQAAYVQPTRPILAVVMLVGSQQLYMAIYHPESDTWQLDGWSVELPHSDIVMMIFLCEA